MCNENAKLLTKAVKITSKKLQERSDEWSIRSSYGRTFQFRTFHYILDLKAPENTVTAQCVNGIWCWIVKVDKLDIVTGKFYRVDYGSGYEDNFIIGRLKKIDGEHFYWEIPRLKKWRQYEELENGIWSWTTTSYRMIRLASKEDIAMFEDLKHREAVA